MHKPYYPNNPIGSIEKLSLLLGVRPEVLKYIASDVDNSYVEFQIESSRGKKRTVADPKYNLKKLQKRINSRIFECVEFPAYLQGGLKSDGSKRDYVENAKMHGHSKHIINLDLKNFYDNIRPAHVLQVYQNFFNFPLQVAEILTTLTTLRGKAPQGACTSSYLANLVFFNFEYSLVLTLEHKGLTYTRLLDDMTISSKKPLNQSQQDFVISKVKNMITKFNFKLNNSKTKSHTHPFLDGFDVTGLWVGHKEPKLRKKDRRYIRQLVYICEQEYKKDCTNDEYHKLWNTASGKVAVMTRLKHPQSKDLRVRLGKSLPKYSDQMKDKIIMHVKKLCNTPNHLKKQPGTISKFNKLYYKLGILARNEKALSKDLKKQMIASFPDRPAVKNVWEQ